MVIDIHIHYCPEKFIKPNLGPNQEPVTTFGPAGNVGDTLLSLRYDLEKFIDMMDCAGVDMALLTSGAGMRGDIETGRFVNDDMKLVEERYPGRFLGAAHVPPLGGKESLEELQRCRDELGYKCAVMHSVVRGTLLDSPDLYPFYEKVEELGLFLIVHPGASEFTLQYDYDIARSVCREGHLAETTVRLIEGGILDRFPQLKIVMSHLGGHFCACLSRIECYQDKVFWGTQDHPRHSKKSKMPFRRYLDKMYFDTGGIQGSINPIKMALMELSPQNILYGTDYPLEMRDGPSIREFVRNIRDMPLPQSDIDNILGNNARKLLGII